MALMSQQIHKSRRWYFSHLETEPCDDLAFGYMCLFFQSVIPEESVRELSLFDVVVDLSQVSVVCFSGFVI